MSGKNAIEPIDLDADLDDIDDLPSFSAWPTGAYVVVLDKGIESKKVNDHPCLEVSFTLKEVAELNSEHLDEGEDPPKEGDISSILFMMDNAIGAGSFKEFAKPIAEVAGSSKVRAIVETSKGLEMLIVVKRRKGKKGTESEDKNFMSIAKCSVM
jgi:hypothetical protein